MVFQARCWVSEGSGAPITDDLVVGCRAGVGVVGCGVGGWCLGAFFGSPRALCGWGVVLVGWLFVKWIVDASIQQAAVHGVGGVCLRCCVWWCVVYVQYRMVFCGFC